MEQNTEGDIYVQFPNPEDLKVFPADVERLWPVGQSKSDFQNSQGKELVVVLLGWAGAEHKYLSKYSDFYLKRGCIVLRYITPTRYHLVGNQRLPMLAQKILKFMYGLQLDSHPIFFHVFSNGGAYTYSYVLKELAKSQNAQMNIKGTIFDSAPCPRNLQRSYKAMLSIFGNLKSFRYVAAALVIFILICQIFWYHLRNAIRFCIHGDTLDSLENRHVESAPLTNWLGSIADMKKHNFLFLYSDSDELIPVDQVERFADILKARGSNVEKVRFNGSAHVMHYRKYPKEYANAVIEFVQSVMTRSQEEGNKANIDDE